MTTASTQITVETTINRDIETVWKCWNFPEHITKWMHASPDWECPKAENDLRVGGRFSTTLSAKDKSVSFDIVGTYTVVEENKKIAYTMDDNRTVSIVFIVEGDKVHIIETFEIEHENPPEMQRAGWQAILDNFKVYTEGYK